MEVLQRDVALMQEACASCTHFRDLDPGQAEMLGFCCSFAFAGPRDPSPVAPDYRFRPDPLGPQCEMCPPPCLTWARGERLMEYHDRVLKCAECGAEFVFTAGEQMFFADKGFKNEPKRCKGCKAKRAEGGGGGGASQMRSETKTTCSQCGKETTVPFRPTQGRPVFCRECFQQRRALGAA